MVDGCEMLDDVATVFRGFVGSMTTQRMYKIGYIKTNTLGHQGDDSNAEVIVYAAAKY